MATKITMQLMSLLRIQRNVVKETTIRMSWQSMINMVPRDQGLTILKAVMAIIKMPIYKILSSINNRKCTNNINNTNNNNIKILTNIINTSNKTNTTPSNISPNRFRCPKTLIWVQVTVVTLENRQITLIIVDCINIDNKITGLFKA